MNFWENLCDGYKSAGTMFAEAGDSFSKGNIVGGVEKGLMGMLSGLGHTITFGGANWVSGKLGEAMDGAFESTIDENGVVQWVPTTEGGILAHTAGSMIIDRANNYLKQDHYEDTGNIAAANGTAAIALAEDAAVAATVATGVGGVTAAAAAGATGAAAAGGTGAAIAGAAAKSGAKFLGKHAAASVLLNTIGSTVLQSVEENVYDKNDGNPENDKTLQGHIVSETVENVFELGTGVINDSKDLLEDGTNMLVPGLGKFFNTISAGMYATGIVASRTGIGAYASAACSKAVDSVKAWATAEPHGNSNKTISEIAGEKSKQSEKLNHKGWFELYAEKVRALDREDFGKRLDRTIADRFDGDENNSKSDEIAISC